MVLLPIVGLLLIVGRLVLLPPRAKDAPLANCGRVDILPPLVKLLRPLLGNARLIDPVELPCLTLAT